MKVKRTIRILITILLLLFSLVSCSVENSYTEYQDSILSGELLGGTVFMRLDFWYPDSYNSRYTNCDCRPREEIVTETTTYSFAGETYIFDSQNVKKGFSLYTNEDIIRFKGHDKFGNEYIIEYCEKSGELVRINYYNEANSDNEPISAKDALNIAREYLDGLMVNKYGETLDFSQYELFSKSFDIKLQATQIIYRFCWYKKVNNVTVHEVIVDVNPDGSIKSCYVPPIIDEEVLKKIPLLTEEQYCELAISYNNAAYEAEEGVEFSNTRIKYYDNAGRSTLELVYLDHPRKTYAVRYLFCWTAIADDGRWDYCEQYFYIPIKDL